MKQSYLNMLVEGSTHILAAKFAIHADIPPAETLAGVIARMLCPGVCCETAAYTPWPRGSVDYPAFKSRTGYCRSCRAGYEDLKWSVGEVLREADYEKQQRLMVELMEEGVMESSEPFGFLLRLSVCGHELAFETLRAMIECGCCELFEKCYEQLPNVREMISPRSLLLWACADGRFSDEEAVRMVRMIERVSPGIVAQTVDVFGDTPLWYTLYRSQFGGFSVMRSWEEKCPMLEEELIRSGCRSGMTNVLGVSWEDVREELRRIGHIE